MVTLYCFHLGECSRDFRVDKLLVAMQKQIVLNC